MDSLWGISVEYKLDAYNMPRTGPTLCHPKIGYVDPSVTPLSTHKLPIHRWSTLMEITHTPPPIPDTKLHGDPKHNPSHVPQHTLPSQHLATPFLPILTSLNSTSLAAPKANPIFHVANKKNFLCCFVKEKFRHSFVLPKKI